MTTCYPGRPVPMPPGLPRYASHPTTTRPHPQSLPALAVTRGRGILARTRLVGSP
jgi:hypothetical protein